MGGRWRGEQVVVDAREGLVVHRGRWKRRRGNERCFRVGSQASVSLIPADTAASSASIIAFALALGFCFFFYFLAFANLFRLNRHLAQFIILFIVVVIFRTHYVQSSSFEMFWKLI